jgi:hypothetical protein
MEKTLLPQVGKSIIDAPPLISIAYPTFLRATAQGVRRLFFKTKIFVERKSG